MTAQGVFIGVKVHLIDSKSEPDVSSDCCTHRNLNTTLPGPAASIFGPEIDLNLTIFLKMAAQGVFLGVKVHLIDSKSEPDVSSGCCTHRNLNTTLPGPAASIFGPEIDLKFTSFLKMVL